MTCLIQKYLQFLILAILVSPNALIAKTVNTDHTEQQMFLRLIQAIYSKLENLPKASNDIKLSQSILTQTCESPDVALYKAEALRSEAEMLNKDWGVELRGRLTSESLQDDEDSDGSLSRGYVELSWDVLKNGLRQNTDNAQILYKKAELLELQEKSNKIIRTQHCIGYKLDKAFVAYTSQILTLKLQLLELIYPIEQRAYFKGWNRFDDLVVTDSELKLARHELNFLHSSGHFDDAIINLQVPADIDIDMDALVLAIRENAFPKQYSELQKDILAQQKKAADDNQLRFFVRDNLIQNDSFEPQNVVVGLNFIVPFTRDSDKPLVNSIKALDEQEKMQDWERLLKVRNAYVQVRYQQKQLIKQKARFLRATERIRQTMAEIKLLNNYELLSVAATRLRTALDAGFELIQVRQSLYLRINQVFLAAGIEIQPRYLRLFDTEFAKNKSRVGTKSLYVWSHTFNTFPNQQIFDFLNAKGIREVLLSAGKKTDMDKFNEFVIQAEQVGVLLTTVIGTNEWALPAKHQQAAIRSAIAIEKSQRLHLDIEPHTLSGYHNQREEILKNYLTMIRGVRKAIGNRFLSVSVPVHWPEEIYRQLADEVDQINVMAYGNNKIEKIYPKIQKIMNLVPRHKIVVALNMVDFSDAWAVESMISQLHKRTLIEQFSLHSFKSLLKFSANHK